MLLFVSKSKLQLLPPTQNNLHVFICTKRKENYKTFFIYKKLATFQKARQFMLRFIYKKQHTLCHAIFSWTFEVGIFIQKEWNFALHDVSDTKTGQFNRCKTVCLRFWIKNLTIFVTRFFMAFLAFTEGGAHFYMQKECTLRYICICKKNHFALSSL